MSLSAYGTWRDANIICCGVTKLASAHRHLVFEKNKPAAAIYPFWWSVLNDIRMLGHFLTGTLKAELEKAKVITPP